VRREGRISGVRVCSLFGALKRPDQLVDEGLCFGLVSNTVVLNYDIAEVFIVIGGAVVAGLARWNGDELEVARVRKEGLGWDVIPGVGR